VEFVDLPGTFPFNDFRSKDYNHKGTRKNGFNVAYLFIYFWFVCLLWVKTESSEEAKMKTT
jgi:hypothetical protein